MKTIKSILLISLCLLALSCGDGTLSSLTGENESANVEATHANEAHFFGESITYRQETDDKGKPFIRVTLVLNYSMKDNCLAEIYNRIGASNNFLQLEDNFKKDEAQGSGYISQTIAYQGANNKTIVTDIFFEVAGQRRVPGHIIVQFDPLFVAGVVDKQDHPLDLTGGIEDLHLGNALRLGLDLER